MDIKEWENSFHGPSGVTRIHQIWSQIQSRSYLDNPLFYEYLCVCIFLAISEHVKISYNLKLNDDFEPKSVAPSGKPDIVVEFDNFFLVIEATLRPIDGKVDHFSHLKLIDSINNVMGLLVVPDIQKVDDQVWNTYKAYFNHDKDRKSTRLNSSHSQQSRMPSSA